MKRGIIMERHRHYMIVMDKDGVFHKAEPAASAEVGTEVEYKPIQNGRFHRFLLTGKSVKKRTKIAVMTVLVMLITFPLYAWYNGGKVYAYVNVDINPSVEMEVDEAMKVKSIRPLNDDAEQILVELGTSWKNRTVEEVTSLLIEQGKKDQLIDGENVVIIGVSYLDGQEKEKHITDTLDDYFNRHPQEELSVATFEVPEKIREAARSERKSMNELFAEEVDKQVEADKDALQIDDQEKELIQSYYHKDDHDEESDLESTDTVTEQEESKTETSDNLADNSVNQTEAILENRQNSELKTKEKKQENSREWADKKKSDQPDAAKKAKEKTSKQERKEHKKRDTGHKSKHKQSIKQSRTDHPNKNKSNQAERKKQRNHQQKKKDNNNGPHGRGSGGKKNQDHD